MPIIKIEPTSTNELVDDKFVRRERTDYPPGSYCPLSYRPGAGHCRDPKNYIVLSETHAGLCLYDWEHNGRDDSDFYMRVWDPEKRQPKTIMFATTRGWTYPAYGSSPDATDEVKAAFARWEKAQAIKARRRRAREAREKREEWARSTGRTVEDLDRLRATLTPGEFDAITRLLKTGHNNRFRSKFRKSLFQQVVDWLTGGNDYRLPLSRRQMEFL